MKEFPFSPAPLRKIKAVQFGILSPDEISAMSVCKIESPETNEIGQPNVPKKGGLNDPSLGTTDRSGKCTTCESNYLDCPGHFGHIQLNKPVFQVGFMTKTLKVLRCICDQCGKLLVSRLHSKFHEATRSRNPRTRLRKVMDLCKSVSTCQPDDPENPDPKRGCGAVQHKYMKKGLSITKQDRAAKRIAEEVQYITPEEVYHIFKLMTDDDIKALGFNPIHARPEWMLTTMLPVCPPTVRPSIQQDGMPGGQDDLTYILVNIIKANDNLGRNEKDGAAPHIITDYYQLLQYLVATYVDNEIPGLPRHKHKTGRPFKSIRARLKGKEGRIRGNLMGKRVDFSARTVIGPDPNLWLDQVGVPRSIALNLTYPEVVTPLNIQRLEALVRNGPNEHPGAKYVIRDNGERIDLRFNRRDVHLQPGYQVERHLADDDIVLFNRQPSLHKMSMMGHRVKVMPYSTFRLNLSVTTPYNADFDGDEMNLHVPQTIEARVELLELALVPTQIVSPQSNRPVMGIVQDSLNGINKFTRRDVFLDKAAVMQLLMWVSDWDGIIPVPAIIKPKPLWTGKQMVSLIIPDVNIVRKHATHDDKIPNADFSVFDTNVLIERGELLTGMVCKKTVGQSGGSLIHVIWNQHGPKAAASFFTNCQFLVNNWMLMNGFSVGIGDCIANPNTMIKIERIINDSKKSVEGLIEKAQTGEFDREPGMTLRESVESRINKELSDTRNKAGTEAMKSLKPDNNFKQMINAGSKGSELNISQIAACVGQQNVEGKRIPFAFRRRTLPHFQKDSYGPESRGFVENSYLRGLMPQEFFFHAMGGREGLIDTAVKTSETGYIQRRLVKAMEDLIARYDGTVRNSVGEIIQFLYGEDGLNAIMVEEQTLDLLTLNDDDFIKKYRIDMDISNTRHIFLERNNIVNASIAQAVSSEPLEVQKALEEEFRQLQHDRKTLQDKMYLKLNGNRCFLPVNIRRFIWNAQNLFSVDRRKPSDLNPINIVNKVQMLCKQLVAVPGADKLSQEAQQNATLLLQILIRSTLSVKTVLLEHHLDEKAFDWLLGEIETTFLKALVHPGETVGTIAAQSIGEPATQMTLRTFHFAGVGAKNVTLGVPRLRELINVAKKIKTPQLTIYLKSLAANNTDIAQAVKARIEHASLRDVSAISEIYFDADIKNSVVLEDREFVKDWLESEYIDGEVPYFSPWMLRLELDRKMMLDHRLSTIDVSRKIEGKFGSIEFEQTGQETNTSMPIKCIYSDDNADKLIIRVHLIDSTRMYGDEEKDPGHATEGNEKLLKEFENQLMAEISLAGIKEITQVKIDDEDVLKIGTDGKDKGKLIHVKENVLRTSGVNLLAVLSHEDIDAVRTVSNDIVETIEVLGIEAARQSLMTELKRVIEFDGSYVNNRHLSCLCDVMTYKGYLMAITRHGINRNDTGPLMRCSFEETVEILVEAAAFAELDEMRGVSENIMLGQMGPFGTGEFDVLLAEDMLSDAIVDPNAPVSMGYFPGAQTPGMPTPMMGSRSPLYHQQYSPSQTPLNAQFSPSLSSSLPGQWSPMGSRTGYSPSSPSYSPSSPSYSPSSPSYSPSSPSYSPSSPSYSPSSPSYSPTSPKYSATSPRYSPTSPSHLGSAASPNYSPSSPAHISPTSPSYSPTSPKYTAASPSYSPSSPSYSMTSPAYSPTSPSYSMTSPAYSPTSPSYNQPRYGTTSPNYSPTSPSYQAGLSPTSPSYSPSSPSYSPTSPSYNAQISPTSPSYSPTSPSYSPVGGMYRTPQPPTSS